MRTIAALVVLLIANTLSAQDESPEVFKGNWSAFPYDYSTIQPNTTLPPSFFTSGPAIEEGAFRVKYEEALAQVEVQKRDIADLRGIIHDLEAKLTCVCGEGCQCDAGGTACQCPKGGKAAAPVEQWSITLVSMDNCPACPPAKAYHEPRYRAGNWQWHERSDGWGRPGMSYPYFEVCFGDSCHVIQCRSDQLDGAIAQLIAQRNQRPVQDKRGRFLGNW